MSDKDVTILLGNGSGGFTRAAGLPVTAGDDPRDVAVGDFNGDGVQDLAVANADSVTVFLGNGSGGFYVADGSPFHVGTGPASLAVGDFNGDGIQDLAAANRLSDTVTVLLGNGSGGFLEATGSPFATGTSPASMIAADFNGDGIQDLAVTNADTNDVTVLLGNASGGFAAASGNPYAAGNGSGSLAAGDFNGDGIVDLAVANFGDGDVTILSGFLTGQIAQAIAFEPLSATANSGAEAIASTFLTISARASSGLPVRFSSRTRSVCTVAGNRVSLLAPGICSITATQPGNASYSAATPVTQTVTVGVTPQTITFAAAGPLVAGSSSTLTATASSGLAVGFASTPGFVCTVAGSTLTLVGAGNCSVTASQAGNANYAAAVSVTQTFSVLAAGTVHGLSASGQITTIATASATGGVAVDQMGNCYFANGIVISRLDGVTGIVTTVAGTGVYGYSGDGGPATAAQLFQPSGVALDAVGNLYISDATNDNVRMVAAATGIITTVAGRTATPGNTAVLDYPHGVVVDSSGNLYIANTGSQVVLKVAVASGISSVIAGSYYVGSESTGDGGLATAAHLDNPSGLALDANGNLLIVEDGRIRRVDAVTNIITTIAGGADIFGPLGDGGQAVDAAVGVGSLALDNMGNLYITDGEFYRIRKIDRSGIITTIAGSGRPGYLDGPALSAELSQPTGIAVDALANIYFIDSGHVRFLLTSTITQAPQTVAFAALANQTYPVTPFSPTATASSGLGVTFSSSTPGVCTVSGATVTVLGGGLCSITATQSGNAVYLPAYATQTFNVALAASSWGWRQTVRLQRWLVTQPRLSRGTALPPTGHN